MTENDKGERQDRRLKHVDGLEKAKEILFQHFPELYKS